MSKCNFNIPFSGSASDLVEKARKSIVKAGGEVSGNVSAGNFFIPSPLGKISGTYTITASIANFDITEKPMFIGCDMIESTIKKFITQDPIS
jgi:hypothetical protein